jgi:nucleoside-diphosphate-sugar epimerase
MELLRAFAKYGGRRSVMAGTCAEYDWNYGICSESSTPLAPRTIYGECKHSLQKMADAFSREAALSSAWGRIFFLFGPHEHPDRLVSSVIRSLLLGEVARCTTGEQERDFLYVERAASAFVALLESAVEGPVNIASGRAISVKELVTKIGERIGRGDLIRYGDRTTPANDPPRLLADVTRLREEVGWRVANSLDADLEAAIAWWKDALTLDNAEGSDTPA